jgi:hypothetical protein
MVRTSGALGPMEEESFGDNGVVMALERFDEVRLHRNAPISRSVGDVTLLRGWAIILTAVPQFRDAWLFMTKTYTLTAMRRRDRNRTLDGKPVDCGRQPSKAK